LTATAEGATEVSTTSEVSIVGLLAQFGGRMINDVSGKIFEEFTKSFREQLAEMSDGSAPAGAATAEAKASAEAQASSATVGSADPAPAPQSRPAQKEPEPIKALPLLLSALGDALLRFIRRIFERSEAS